MEIKTIILLGLATWRISFMLMFDAGPGDIFIKFRKARGIDHGDDGIPFSYPPGFWGELLSCMYCTSIWVGLVLGFTWAVLPVPTEIVCIPFMLSAIAIIIQEK